MEYQAPSIEKRQSVVALMTKSVHPHSHPNHATLVSATTDCLFSILGAWYSMCTSTVPPSLGKPLHLKERSKATQPGGLIRSSIRRRSFTHRSVSFGSDPPAGPAAEHGHSDKSGDPA